MTTFRHVVTVSLLCAALSAHASTPDAAALQTQSNPTVITQDIRSVARFLNSSRIDDGRQLLAVVNYTQWAFERLSTQQAEDAEGTGKALTRLVLREPQYQQVAIEHPRLQKAVLAALVESKASWTLPRLVELAEDAQGATRLLVIEAMVAHLNKRPIGLKTDTKTETAASYLLAELRQVAATDELRLAGNHVFTLEGMIRNSPRVEANILNGYVLTAVDRIAAERIEPNSPVAVSLFNALDKRRFELSDVSRQIFDTAFAHFAPERFAAAYSTRLNRQDAYLPLLLLRAANTAPDHAWALHAFESMQPYFEFSFVQQKDVFQLMEMAALQAKFSDSGRILLAALVRSGRLTSDVEGAALSALATTASAAEPTLAQSVNVFLANKAARSHSAIQYVSLAYSARIVAAWTPSETLNALARYARNVEVTKPLAFDPLLDSVGVALASREQLQLSATENALVRDLMTIAPAHVFTRLRAYSGKATADQLYQLLVPNIAATWPQLNVDARDALLAQITALFGGTFAQLSADKQTHLVNLFSQYIRQSADADSALSAARHGLAIVANHAELSARLKQDILRRVGTGQIGVAATAEPTERAIAVLASVDQARIEALFGQVKAPSTPALPAMEYVFEQASEVAFFGTGVPVYKLHDAKPLPFTSVLVFDQQGRLHFWSHTHLGATVNPSEFAVTSSIGSATLNKDGVLNVDGLDGKAQNVLARQGLALTGATFKGAALPLAMAIPVDFSAPAGLNHRASAVESGLVQVIFHPIPVDQTFGGARLFNVAVLTDGSTYVLSEKTVLTVQTHQGDGTPGANACVLVAGEAPVRQRASELLRFDTAGAQVRSGTLFTTLVANGAQPSLDVTTPLCASAALISQ